MKSLKTKLLAASMALVFTTAASATSFVFVDGHLQGNDYVKLESWGVNSYSNTWDISGQAGFSTGLVFDSAEASFWLSDDADAQDEFVSIDLGSLASWITSAPVGGTFASYHLISGTVGLSVLADIAADGKLSYEVRADAGDFYLKETRLTVYAHVPEAGSTLALLGLAFLGLAVISRRRK